MRSRSAAPRAQRRRTSCRTSARRQCPRAPSDRRRGTAQCRRCDQGRERATKPLAAEQGGWIDSGWTGERHDGCGHRSQPDGQRVQFGRGATGLGRPRRRGAQRLRHAHLTAPRLRVGLRDWRVRVPPGPRYGGQPRRWVGAPEPLQALRGLADRRMILGPCGVELHHPGVRHEHARVAQCVRRSKNRYPFHPDRRHSVRPRHRRPPSIRHRRRRSHAGAASPRIRGEHRSCADRRAGTEAGTTQSSKPSSSTRDNHRNSACQSSPTSAVPAKAQRARGGS